MKKIDIELEIGTDNLLDYLSFEIKEGRESAKEKIYKLFLSTTEKLIKLDNSKESDLKQTLEYIIFFREYYLKISCVDFAFYEKQSKMFSSFSHLNNDERNQEIASFIIENTNIESCNHKLKQKILISKLKNIREESECFYIVHYFEKNLINLCNLLKNIENLIKFDWSPNNFDNGIINILNELNSRHQKKIIELKQAHAYELEKLEDKITKLKSKNQENEVNNKFLEEYVKKYPIMDYSSYFGDNIPFLLSVFNFLKNNHLTFCSWSFFCFCLFEKNEMKINLEKSQNMKFIGRIFFNLSDFLLPKYKNDYESFFRSKFLIDNEPINNSFFTNHVKISIDKSLNHDLDSIDNFFVKSKNTYNKI